MPTWLAEPLRVVWVIKERFPGICGLLPGSLTAGSRPHTEFLIPAPVWLLPCGLLGALGLGAAAVALSAAGLWGKGDGLRSSSRGQRAVGDSRASTAQTGVGDMSGGGREGCCQ